MPSSKSKELIAPNKKELPLSFLCWFAYLLGFPLLLSLFPALNGEELHKQFLYNLALYVLSFSLILLVYRDFLFRSKMPFPIFLVAVFFGLLATYGLSNFFGSILYTFLQFFPIERENLNQSTVVSFLQAYRIPMILQVVILAPVVEEILFRGTIFGPLCKKSPFLAYVASMALFSAMHILGSIGDQTFLELLISFVEYLPAGFALCFCYQHYRSIWVPIAVHGLMNLLSTMLIV